MAHISSHNYHGNNIALKRIMICCIILVLMCVNMPCMADIHAARKPKLAKTKLNMYVGESYKFNNKKCSFASSNKKIASVNSKGKVKAKKPGNARITVKSKKNGKKSVCSIRVGAYVSSLKLNSATNVILKPGQTSQMSLVIAPTGVLYKDIYYISSDSNIVTVSSTGLLTPVSAGMAEVTATTKAVNSKKKTLNKKITVVVMKAADDNTLSSPNGSTNPPVVVEEKQDLIGSQDGFDIIVTPVIVPTKQPYRVVSPTPAPSDDTRTAAPGSSSTPAANGRTASPKPSESVGEASPKPTQSGGTKTPEASASAEVPTSVPSPTAEPTQEPTARPVTMKEYIDSLHPADNEILAGSIVVANASGQYRTLYFINKNYTGNMKVIVDGYSYSTNGSATDFLSKLQNETGGATNSAETVEVWRKKRNTAWAVELLKEGRVYYISGVVDDTIYGSPYGLITAEGDTLEHIIISE